MSSRNGSHHLAAAVLLQAIQHTNYLLDLHEATDDQLFEGFTALVWIWSRESTSYFESTGRDPDWGRRRLSLEPHVKVALQLVEERHSWLFDRYLYATRQHDREMKRKRTSNELLRLAQAELGEAIFILSHCHAAPTLPLEHEIPQVSVVVSGNTVRWYCVAPK